MTTAIKVRSPASEWIVIHHNGSGSPRYALEARLDGSRLRLSHALARDFVRVGTAVFLADRSVRRGDALGAQTRMIELIVPVEQPRLWQSRAAKVERLVDFVTADRWRIRFVRETSAPAARKRVTPRSRQRGSDAVHLFSGGLDSLCGAAASYARAETPVFVTLSPPGTENVAKLLAQLRSALGAVSIPSPLFNFRLAAHDRDRYGHRRFFPERSRRTRPVFFLSFAAAVAVERNIGRICLNENGVLAVNLPLRSYITGPRVSRHAHPRTLALFADLLDSVWPYRGTCVVENPLDRYTKGEQLALLGAAASLAEQTISCEYVGQQMSIVRSRLGPSRRRRPGFPRECGLCMPCLVRRAALHAAKIREEHNHYAFSIRPALRRRSVHLPLYNVVAPNVRDLQAFCREIATLAPRDFWLRFSPELADLVMTADVADVAESVFELYRRYGSEVMEYLET